MILRLAFGTKRPPMLAMRVPRRRFPKAAENKGTEISGKILAEIFNPQYSSKNVFLPGTLFHRPSQSRRKIA